MNYFVLKNARNFIEVLVLNYLEDLVVLGKY